jgi:hypothetical protein
MAIHSAEHGGRGEKTAMVLVALFALANALHMTKKAYEVGARTAAVEGTIRATYPHVDHSILAEIYFDQPETARLRLETLRTLGFPPFDEPNDSASK